VTVLPTALVYVLERVYRCGRERMRHDLTTLLDTGCFRSVDDVARLRSLALRVT